MEPPEGGPPPQPAPGTRLEDLLLFQTAGIAAGDADGGRVERGRAAWCGPDGHGMEITLQEGGIPSCNDKRARGTP